MSEAALQEPQKESNDMLLRIKRQAFREASAAIGQYPQLANENTTYDLARQGEFKTLAQPQR